MRASLAVADAISTGAAIVATGWLSKVGLDDPDGPYAVPSKPSRASGWQLLGYDVPTAGC